MMSVCVKKNIIPLDGARSYICVNHSLVIVPMKQEGLGTELQDMRSG